MKDTYKGMYKVGAAAPGRKRLTMLNKELLKSLNTAFQENDKERFVDLCVFEGITNVSEYNNFHSLDVVKSTITETNNTFIDNLYKLVDDENYTLLEQLDRFNAEGLFRNYYLVAQDIAFELYCDYEDELDSILIWDNAETIIEDLDYYLSTHNE